MLLYNYCFFEFVNSLCERRLYAFFSAFCTDSSVVELFFQYDVSFNFLSWFHFWSWFAEKVNYLATISAIEMNVAFNISIITYAMFIDCDHLSRIVLTQHSECVVNGCLAQCWDTLG